MTEFRDIVAVGASAGGVEALRNVAAGLPPDYSGTVLVVLHVPRSSPSALPAILSRSGPLPARAAVDGEPLLPGHIYVAPADHHLLLLDDRLRLTRGPAENGHRPAIDPLFRSVARVAGHRAVGVVLSGSRDDGAAGLASIAAAGGATIVQDPADALHPWMPRAAIDRVTPDHVAPADKIGVLLAELSTTPLPDAPPPHDTLLDAEVAMSEFEPITTDNLAPPAGYGCPSCGGSLFEIDPAPHPRFRCRVGHAWSPESLLEEQEMALESALWVALRALEEKSALSRRLADLRRNSTVGVGERFAGMAEEAESAGDILRRLISSMGSAVEPDGDVGASAGGPGTHVR